MRERTGAGLRGLFAAVLAAALFLSTAALAARAALAPGPIRIAVDATHVGQRVLSATLVMPVHPGELTLYYPKWLPADHSPDGPIANLAGLHFSAGGRPLAWRQDLDDMYTFHVTIPPGAGTLTVRLKFLLSAPGPAIDFSADASARLLILMWNTVLLYPAGWPVHQLTYLPRLRLPQGWSWHTSLPVAEQAAGWIQFRPVPLDLLVDSPVQAGVYTRAIRLSPAASPDVELDLAADHRWALDIPPELIAHYRELVAQAGALFQSYHYRDYHFLLTLSNNVLPLGQEHHESSDDRVPERMLSSPGGRLLGAGLLAHEYTHSWNGQYRRPRGLATPDFQKPMEGTLLWVYEGLTSYVQTVLAARSGLETPADAHAELAEIAAMLSHRAGFRWRSLQNTADAAQILYFAPPEWQSERRGTDFYTQSVLLWLGVDCQIRRLSGGRRSLDDFLRLFAGGENGRPVIRPYDFDDLVGYLNRIAPSDWSSYLRARLDATSPGLMMANLQASGWRLVYNGQPNVIGAARAEMSGGGNYMSSLGMTVNRDGKIVDVAPGTPAFAAGLGPYLRILGVDGAAFSVPALTRAVARSREAGSTISLLASNTGTLSTYQIHYSGGLRDPHLERMPGTADVLDRILRPLPVGPREDAHRAGNPHDSRSSAAAGNRPKARGIGGE